MKHFIYTIVLILTFISIINTQIKIIIDNEDTKFITIGEWLP